MLYNVHSVKRYTVAQVRERLASALDEVERGVPVVIERRGVRYVISLQPRKARAGPAAVDHRDARSGDRRGSVDVDVDGSGAAAETAAARLSRERHWHHTRDPARHQCAHLARAGPRRAAGSSSEAGEQLYVSPATLLELQFLIEVGRIRLRTGTLERLAEDDRWLLDDPPAAAWFTSGHRPVLDARPLRPPARRARPAARLALRHCRRPPPQAAGTARAARAVISHRRSRGQKLHKRSRGQEPLAEDQEVTRS